VERYDSIKLIQEDEIDLLELVRILVKRKTLIIMVTIIVSLISVVAGGINYYKGKTVSIIIGYNYDGIGKGLNIDGSQFTARDIKSTVIARRVYSKYPILKENGISLTKFIAAIEIKGITPNSISDLAESTLKKGQKFIFNPVDYVVRLKLTNDTVLDSKILNDLTDEHIKYFNYKYKENDTAPTINIEDINKYDYEDRVKIIELNADIGKRMAKRLSNKDFVSKSTGLAYEDVSRILSSIEEVDLKNISSAVEVSNITDNIEERKLVIDNKIRKFELEKNKANGRVQVLKGMLEKYKPSSRKMILPTIGETGIKISTEAEYYTKLLRDYETTATRAKELEIEIAEQMMIKSQLNDNNKEAKERVSKEIETVVVKYNKIAAKINVMNQEYYNKYFANSVRVIAPTSVSSDSKAKIIVLAGIILGIMLGLGSAFLAEFIDQYRKNK